MSNIDRHPECHMRTALGNCDPIGGFCTSVNESICEALHNVSRPQGEWIGEADGYADGEFVYDTWYCSNCDYVVDDDEPPTWNFCPNCGCRMKGTDND